MYRNKIQHGTWVAANDEMRGDEIVNVAFVNVYNNVLMLFTI